MLDPFISKALEVKCGYASLPVVRQEQCTYKTFKAASKTIFAMLNHPDVEKFFLGMRIEWSFNLEKAPWWGGFFERLIGSTKRCLKRVIGSARLSYDELLTVLQRLKQF